MTSPLDSPPQKTRYKSYSCVTPAQNDKPSNHRRKRSHGKTKQNKTQQKWKSHFQPSKKTRQKQFPARKQFPAVEARRDGTS